MALNHRRLIEVVLLVRVNRVCCGTEAPLDIKRIETRNMRCSRVKELDE